MRPYAAVITEYDPFHHGHEYQISRIKDEFSACVCVMSSFAVQRGGMSVCDKYSRARAAVECGASLVLELPFPYCSASARDFAKAGVAIAHRSGSEYLAFGIQDDFELIRSVAEYRKRPECEEKIQSLIKSGVSSYPKALEKVIASEFGTDAAAAFRKPNNILAAEYLICLPEGMQAYPIKRDESFLSASEIRKSGDIFGNIPAKAAEALSGAAFTERDRYDAMILAMNSVRREDKNIYGYEKGLYCAVKKAIPGAKSAEEVVEVCKNASYTASRVRRFLLHNAFGVTNGRVHSECGYTLLLAADASGRRILAENNIKNLVTKPADGKKLKGEAHKQFDFAMRSEQTAAVAYDKIYSPLTMSPYIKLTEEKEK